MTARCIRLLAVNEGRRDGARAGDGMAASIGPCPIAHSVAQRTAAKAIA